ncbi:MAG TPA: M15 family metallopeptidase [Oryzihumus sp.]|nr:M15 family metallopeptidase [Oryzihumus sp.]
MNRDGGPTLWWDGEIRPQEDRDGDTRPQGDVTYVVGSPWRLRRGVLATASLTGLAAVGLVCATTTTLMRDEPAPTGVRHSAPTRIDEDAAPVSTAARAPEVQPASRAKAPSTAATPAATSPDGLSAPLARSLEKAEQAARAAGVTLTVTSGRRSRAEQQRLFDAAVRQYGSVAKARRWVLPPAESRHVTGDAVDVGPRSGARWLEVHGVEWGLCRRYVNEWWHFERLAPAIGQACPALEPNAAG